MERTGAVRNHSFMLRWRYYCLHVIWDTSIKIIFSSNKKTVYQSVSYMKGTIEGVFLKYVMNLGLSFHLRRFCLSKIGTPDTLLRRTATKIGEMTLYHSAP